jgi:hypothetical protein
MSATSRCRSKLLSARSAARRSSAHPVLSTQTKNNSESDSDCGPFKSGIYEDLGEDLEGEERCDNIGKGARVVVKVMKNGVEVSQVGPYCLIFDIVSVMTEQPVWKCHL